METPRPPILTTVDVVNSDFGSDDHLYSIFVNGILGPPFRPRALWRRIIRNRNQRVLSRRFTEALGRLYRCSGHSWQHWLDEPAQRQTLEAIRQGGTS